MPKKVDKRVPMGKKRPKSPQEKKKILIKVALIALAVIAALVLAIVAIYHIAVDYYLGKINYETKETGLVFETEIIENTVITQEETVTEPEKPTSEDSQLPNICDSEDITNILLLASDSRGSHAGLSDTMILVSINEKTKKIVLCSFLRDILATFPETPASPVAGKQAKLNSAHAYGGATLTMAVLKETFNIDVKYYAKVSVYDFTKIIDAMGGLDVPLTSDEVGVINYFLSYETTMNEIIGTTEADQIKNIGDGVYHLNGKQVLAHARNRNIGSDWGRTQRQRQVIELAIAKVGTLSLTQIMNLFEQVLPLVTTNMPKQMLKEMVGDALSYVRYDRVSTRIPENGTYSEENYNIIVYPENIFRLYEEIYGYAAADDPRYTVAEPKVSEN